MPPVNDHGPGCARSRLRRVAVPLVASVDEPRSASTSSRVRPSRCASKRLVVRVGPSASPPAERSTRPSGTAEPRPSLCVPRTVVPPSGLRDARSRAATTGEGHRWPSALGPPCSTPISGGRSFTRAGRARTRERSSAALPEESQNRFRGDRRSALTSTRGTRRVQDQDPAGWESRTALPRSGKTFRRRACRSTRRGTGSPRGVVAASARSVSTCCSRAAWAEDDSPRTQNWLVIETRSVTSRSRGSASARDAIESVGVSVVAQIPDGRRLLRGRPRARRVPRAAVSEAVAEGARNGYRARCQPRARRAWASPCGESLRVRPLLRARSHRSPFVLEAGFFSRSLQRRVRHRATLSVRDFTRRRSYRRA